MTRPRNLLLASIVLVPSFGCLYYWSSHIAETPNEAQQNDTYQNWMPSAATIHSEIGPATGLPNSPQEEARRKKFALLFQSRYRDHPQAVAIGLRFLSDSRLKLMCPARMEPWKMDRIALAAWNETKANFGHSFTIDIYETFIGAAPLKVGELHPVPKHKENVQITYRFPARDPAP